MTDRAFTIFYASETGTAEALAKRVHAESSAHGLTSTLVSCEGFNPDELSKHAIVVCIVSSTGDGDPPLAARKFWRLFRRRKDPLVDIKFTMLGLGDTNYSTYQGFPRKITKRFTDLGAKSFYTRGEADDETGLDEVVEPWIDGLWDALLATFDSIPGPSQAYPAPTDNDTATPPSPSSEVEKIVAPSAPTETTEVDSASPAVANPVSKATTTTATKKKRQVRHRPKKDPLLSKLAVVLLESRPVPTSEVPPTHAEATVTSARYLTTAQATKRVVHVELSFKNTTPDFAGYAPGDAIGLVCQNCANLVDSLLDRLRFDGDKCFSIGPASHLIDKPEVVPSHLPGTFDVRDVFTRYIDIRSTPSKAHLRVLASHCSVEDEKKRLGALAERDGREAYLDLQRAHVSLLDLLHQFPSCAPPLHVLLEHLPHLTPRYYSSSSSPLVVGTNAIHFAFTVVDVARSLTGSVTLDSSTNDTSTFTVKEERFRGLCSTWLEKELLARNTLPSLNDADADGGATSDKSQLTVTVFPRPSGDFKLPLDPTAPVLMIGPGTGVAPFIGFLAHRQQQLLKGDGTKPGESWLFFGCRHEAHDYLYRSEIESYVDGGVLSHLSLAFSRDSEDGKVVYVQDKLVENAEEVYRLITEEHASVYVCGDANGMAKDVMGALASIFRKCAKVEDVAAQGMVAGLMKEKRLLMDVWA
eukprot:TRINITY_DN4899_c0_g1_i1.p1 TRINITY_DN4899_c0_g1~~TRINITY_DN4899_c0_g1_i1.p1  ORF type:complete len:697 (-),score=133.23 TRINITY_DN4899_c0_g1_i1:1270-3360(-)